MASAMAPPAGLSTAINETDARSELVAKGNDIIDVEEDDDEERDDDGPVDVLVKVTSVHIIVFFNYNIQTLTTNYSKHEYFAPHRHAITNSGFRGK